METKKRTIKKIFGLFGLLFFIAIALASASAEQAYKSSGWDGSYGQQTIQHIQQASRGGKYIGNASSNSEAAQMAKNAGYSGYNYYPSTGEVFGY